MPYRGWNAVCVSIYDTPTHVYSDCVAVNSLDIVGRIVETIVYTVDHEGLTHWIRAMRYAYSVCGSKEQGHGSAGASLSVRGVHQIQRGTQTQREQEKDEA